MKIMFFHKILNNTMGNTNNTINVSILKINKFIKHLEHAFRCKKVFEGVKISMILVNEIIS